MIALTRPAHVTYEILAGPSGDRATLISWQEGPDPYGYDVKKKGLRPGTASDAWDLPVEVEVEVEVEVQAGTKPWLRWSKRRHLPAADRRPGRDPAPQGPGQRPIRVRRRKPAATARGAGAGGGDAGREWAEPGAQPDGGRWGLVASNAPGNLRLLRRDLDL
jgi:hypothetical protein